LPRRKPITSAPNRRDIEPARARRHEFDGPTRQAHGHWPKASFAEQIDALIGAIAQPIDGGIRTRMKSRSLRRAYRNQIQYSSSFA